MIIIDESGDITLCVKEYDDFIKVTSGQAAIIREEEEFLVSREVITTSSKPIAMLIGYHKLSNQGRETFTLEDDRVRSMQIWLNVLHSNVFTDQAYLVDLSEIWHITVQPPLIWLLSLTDDTTGNNGQISIRHHPYVSLVRGMVL